MQILDGLEVWSSNLLLRRKAFPYCRFARRRTGFIGQPNPRTVSEGIWSPIKVSICLGGLTGGLTGGRDVDVGVVVETHGEDVAGAVLGADDSGELDVAIILPVRPIHLIVLPVRRDEERSEEHTSELQSLMRISYAVFCLKKKK